MNNLKRLGVTDSFIAQASHYPDMYLARVVSQYKGLYKVATEKGEMLAEVSGKFRHEVTSLTYYPAVGDFVLVDRNEPNSGNAIITDVLMRKSAFIRKAAGDNYQAQIVAANIDIVFICMSLNNDYNLSRMERYLSIAWDSGARPVIILTKADLCPNLASILVEVSNIAVGVDILTTTSSEKSSCEKLLPYLNQGITASFIGSSGVGKSTLINILAGENVLATSSVRKDDDRGRHTTTRRELSILPQGGIVIDTPGMREVGVETANLSKTFSDIDELMCQCRFHDCTHTTEPGCAVQNALATGALNERRYANYQKLKREIKYEGLSSKQLETEKLNTMFSDIGGMKKAREYIRKNDKRRKK